MPRCLLVCGIVARQVISVMGRVNGFCVADADHVRSVRSNKPGMAAQNSTSGQANNQQDHVFARVSRWKGPQAVEPVAEWITS